MSNDMYVGMDVHDATTTVHVQDGRRRTSSARKLTALLVTNQSALPALAPSRLRPGRSGRIRETCSYAAFVRESVLWARSSR